MSLTREQILNHRPLTRSIEVEGVGQILIRPLSVSSLERFMEARESLSAYQIYPFLVGLSACDEQGKLLFEESDRESIGELGIATLKAIGDEILILNKLKDDEPEKAKDPYGVEVETEGGPKNSPTAPSDSGSLRLLSGLVAPSPSSPSEWTPES